MLTAIDPSAEHEWTDPDDADPKTIFLYRVLTARERSRVIRAMGGAEGSAITIGPDAVYEALMCGLTGWQNFGGPDYGADQEKNVDVMPLTAYMGVGRAIIETSFLSDADAKNS